MDRQIPTNGTVVPGISMVNGIVKDEDIKMADVNGTLTNGAAKRKVRESLGRPSYADAESSDDDVPLVRHPLSYLYQRRPLIGNRAKKGRLQPPSNPILMMLPWSPRRRQMERS